MTQPKHLDARRTLPGSTLRRALPMRGFADSLPMTLLRTREAVMRRFRPGLRAHGVTEQQWRILRALAGQAPLEVTALAARTCLLPPSVSRILPDLEARGLIARRGVETDLRRSVVMLTAAGLKLIAAHAPQSEAIYSAIEQRFGAERLEELFRLLRQLEESLGVLPGREARAGAAAGD
jgi:homoprotocatechuate degradation regulator HpaR